MQTILGSGGAIGVQLAMALQKYTEEIRLVSRNPAKVHGSDQLMKADLLNLTEVKSAVRGSRVVYLTAGLHYNLKVWQDQWPRLMRNVIEACKEQDCKLVFFDNLYLYDKNHLNGMTEDTPVIPPSKKGAIRMQISNLLMNEVAEGSLKALIARSADFYGPGIKQSSLLTEMVFKPLSVGKKASWMGSTQFQHSFTFTPDAGRATALLGNTDEAFNQVWHLPTAPHPFTGKQWIEAIAREMGVKPRYQVAPRFMVRLLGLFVPIMKEMVEMIYQYDRDYVFDSSKFEKKFGMVPTSYSDGIRHIVQQDYQLKKQEVV